MATPLFQWDDPFLLDQQLSDEERMVRDSARRFAEDVLLPRVIGDYREEGFDRSIMLKMGEMGLLGYRMLFLLIFFYQF
jgi:glutaryl-CoA dehydrogenase